MRRAFSINILWIIISFIMMLIIISLTGLVNTEFNHYARWTPVLSNGYLLGTDGAGRDMLDVIIVSMRNNILLGLITASVSLLFGCMLGILLGYILNDGFIKSSLVFVARFTKSIPLLIWIFLVVFWIEILGRTTTLFDIEMIKMSWVFSIFGGIYSFNVALLLMGHIQKLKSSQFIEACEFIGLKKKTIIFKHIIWHHSKSLLGSQASYIFAQCILLEITLSFNKIGYGFSKSSLSLGSVFNRAVGEVPMTEHMFIPLIAALILTTTFSYLSQSLEKRYQR